MEVSVVRNAVNILGSLYKYLKEDWHHSKVPVEISCQLHSTPAWVT